VYDLSPEFVNEDLVNILFGESLSGLCRDELSSRRRFDEFVPVKRVFVSRLLV
jgi:hypothetical protein